MKRYRDVELSSDERYEQMLVERAEAEAKAAKQRAASEEPEETITVEEELVYETEEAASADEE